MHARTIAHFIALLFKKVSYMNEAERGKKEIQCVMLDDIGHSSISAASSENEPTELISSSSLSLSSVAASAASFVAKR